MFELVQPFSESVPNRIRDCTGNKPAKKSKANSDAELFTSADLSFLRKQESTTTKRKWIPVFTGMTVNGVFLNRSGQPCTPMRDKHVK